MLSYRPEDQAKVRMAVGKRRIDPADVPASAKPPGAAAPDSAHAGTAAKRKADDAPQAGPSQPAAARPGMRTIRVDDEVEVVQDEEVKDELYVMYKTNIVGVQYYKGKRRDGCGGRCADWVYARHGWAGRGGAAAARAA